MFNQKNQIKNLQVAILEVFTLTSSANFFNAKEIFDQRMPGYSYQYQFLQIHHMLTMYLIIAFLVVLRTIIWLNNFFLFNYFHHLVTDIDSNNIINITHNQNNRRTCFTTNPPYMASKKVCGQWGSNPRMPPDWKSGVRLQLHHIRNYKKYWSYSVKRSSVAHYIYKCS